MIYRDRTVLISNPTEFPDTTDAVSKVLEVQEPVVNASIIVPEGASCPSGGSSDRGLIHTFSISPEFLGEMMDLCFSRRATNLGHRYLDSSEISARVMLTCQFPLSEIVIDFFSLLKSRSSGYASFE